MFIILPVFAQTVLFAMDTPFAREWKNGIRIKIVSTSRTPDNPPVPSLAPVCLGGKDGIRHTILILDKTDDTFILINPLTGRFEWPRHKVYDNYYFDGRLIQII